MNQDHKQMLPTLYVAHPGGSYSVADDKTCIAVGAALQAAGAAEPQPMNETQLLVGVNQLVPVLDEAVLRNKTWKHAALTFVKSAISIRDAMWRHTIASRAGQADTAGGAK